MPEANKIIDTFKVSVLLAELYMKYKLISDVVKWLTGITLG
jgi:hypothetical protein